jgi:hypothetical protein
VPRGAQITGFVRYQKDASPAQRKAWANQLVSILDRLEIAHGEPFLIAHYDVLERRGENDQIRAEAGSALTGANSEGS